MAVNRYLIAYVSTALPFVAMDFVWLTTTTDLIYRPDIGALMLDRPNVPVAVLFYALFMVGVVVFAVLPALTERSFKKALTLGALFGFLAYATFDLTSLASLKGFTPRLAVIDMIWGAVVSGAAAMLGYGLTRRMTGSLTASQT